MSLGSGGNTLIFGFQNVTDLFLTAFGVIKKPIIAISALSLATINTFITHYIYDTASAVYFMLMLVIFDACTGMYKAYKNKVFSSSKLPRIFVLLVLYVFLLGISWNTARMSEFFIFLPSTVYAGILATLLLSIFENLSEVGLIPRRLNRLFKFIESVLNNTSSFAYDMMKVFKKRIENEETKKHPKKRKKSN